MNPRIKNITSTISTGLRQSGWILLLLWGLTLAGCTAPAPEATPTPTRTPQALDVTATALPILVPTATPTPTPTNTATPTNTPTPTPTPIPTFPPMAQEPQGWPALPHDLFFLKEGRLWVWPAQGQNLESLDLPAGQEKEQIIDYRIAPDGLRAVGLSDANHFYAFDRISQTVSLLPTAGYLRGRDGNAHFEISADGQRLIYIAWGVQPGSGPAYSVSQVLPGAPDYGTVMELPLAHPERSETLGFCAAIRAAGVERPCYGLAVGPQRQVIYADGRGIWAAGAILTPPPAVDASGSPLPTPTPPARPTAATGPRMIAPQRSVTGDECGFYQPEAISPDGQWTLLRARCTEGTILAVIQNSGGPIYELPATHCNVACEISAAWGPEGLWIGSSQRGNPSGALQLYQMSFAAAPQPVYTLGSDIVGPVWPTQLHPLTNGQIGFAHQACAACPGMEAGIYFLNADRTISRGASLPICKPDTPAPVCWIEHQGSVSWPADGSTFLYQDAEKNPALLGFTDNVTLWDVREKLKGARSFTWAANPTTP